MNLLEEIVADAPLLTALRHDLHAHPELCFQEMRTAELIANALSEWNIPIHRGLGKTGVVGIIKRGSSERAIGLRADVDALPVSERNTFPHASTNPGVMHACGHDGHVAMLLAAAKCLAARRHFDGTVYLIFQPAEEAGGGAREMISDGLFDLFPMQAVFGMHNWPGLPVGQFAVRAGPVFASSTEFRVSIRGKGTHAAMPHGGIDPVPVACQVVQALQTIVTRNKRPIDAAVIAVTMIRAGEVTNAIPESCELQGTVRAFSIDVLNMIEHRMRQIVAGTCAAFGATFEFEFRGKYPATVNHERETHFIREVARDMVGARNVREFESTLGAEDFSFYLLERPGCYFLIGNGDGDHRLTGHGDGTCTLHSSSYDFNDKLITIGGSLWVQVVEAWFAQGANSIVAADAPPRG